MLEKMDLPDARYSSHTHEDGEISSVVTVYTPSEKDTELLQQLKIGGTPAANQQEAEDSTAREGIRHIEESQDVELEDLHYGELRAVMRQFKIILYRRLRERSEREDLHKELALAGKTMLKFSQNMSSLVCANYSVGQGSEAESYNSSLEEFEKMASELSNDAKNVIRSLKKVKQSSSRHH